MSSEKRIVIRPDDVPTYESVTPDRRRFQLLCEADVTGSHDLAAGTVTLPPGQCQPGSATHPETEEIYYVLKGKGRISVGDDVYEVAEGTFLYIPLNTSHRIYNTDENEELHIFWANTPRLGRFEGYKPLRDPGWRIVSPDGQSS